MIIRWRNAVIVGLPALGIGYVTAALIEPMLLSFVVMLVLAFCWGKFSSQRWTVFEDRTNRDDEREE